MQPIKALFFYYFYLEADIMGKTEPADYDSSQEEQLDEMRIGGADTDGSLTMDEREAPEDEALS